jgi:hypothetical protein
VIKPTMIVDNDTGEVSRLWTWKPRAAISDDMWRLLEMFARIPAREDVVSLVRRRRETEMTKKLRRMARSL